MVSLLRDIFFLFLSWTLLSFILFPKIVGLTTLSHSAPKSSNPNQIIHPLKTSLECSSKVSKDTNHFQKFLNSMASITLSHSFNHRKTASAIQECHTKRISPRSFSMLVISCQNREPNDLKSAKTKKQINKGVFPQIIFGVGKLGKGLKDNLSPKQKGDWKDLTLMSLSFAVYVYISQKLVCAYCAWTSLVG